MVQRENMKLKSFTILEVLLSLLIIGIIIGLIYVFLTFFDRQMLDFQQKNEDTNECQLFVTAIKRDLHKSLEYIYSTQKIILTNYQGDTITYSSERNFLVRTNERGAKDSLLVLSCFFTEHVTPENNFLLLDFKTKILEDTLSFGFAKKQSKATRFNRHFGYEN